MTSIAVAVVNYNTREYLRACLATVHREAASEVVVVDNGSSDGSVEMVRADYPSVVLHSNMTDRGYGAAVNQAVARCTAEYVLLLNSDTSLQPGALRALSGFLDQHPRAAVVGPRLENPDGTLQASCYPFLTPLNTLLVETSLIRVLRHIPILRDHHVHTWPHNQARVVPWVSAAAFAIRREAYETVGGFDESFFMYYEEVDLCYRLHAAGWQVHFAPVTTVVHVGGAGTRQDRADMAVHHFTSAMRFYRRHYTGVRLVELVAILESIIVVRWLIDFARLHTTRNALSHAAIAADVAAWQRILVRRRHQPADDS